MTYKKTKKLKSRTVKRGGGVAFGRPSEQPPPIIKSLPKVDEEEYNKYVERNIYAKYRQIFPNNVSDNIVAWEKWFLGAWEGQILPHVSDIQKAQIKNLYPNPKIDKCFGFKFVERWPF